MPQRPLAVSAAIAVAAALLLAGYEFVRGASNTLFKEAYGKERLPLVMTITPLAVFAILWLYGRALSALGPRRTLFLTSLASALCIAAPALALREGLKPAAWALYVVREAYVILVIEQYWSLLNSTLDEREGRRLNGPICGVASLGAIAGGLLVGRFAVPLGAHILPLIGAATLIPAALCSDLAHRFAGRPRGADDHASPRHSPVTDLGLREFRAAPMLGFLLAVILCTQVVSASLDLAWQGALDHAIPSRDDQTAYQGNAYAAINASAAVLQFVVAPAALAFLPAVVIHLGIPLIHLIAIGLLIAQPSATTATFAYVAFKSADYSIFRAAKELLYVPLSFDARYRAKEIIDVLGYRLGKGGAAALFAVSKTFTAHAPVALAAATLWLALVFPMLKMQSPKNLSK